MNAVPPMLPNQPNRPKPNLPRPDAPDAGTSPWRTRPDPEPPPAAGEPDAAERKKKKKKKEKKLGTERGIETMFRTAYMTHVNLSGLADSKSNIMISINGLIMSIVIGGVSSKIETNPWLLAPTLFLLVGCLASMYYAIQAARPRVSSRVVNLDDVRQNRANVLFFGHFVNMTEADFVEGMADLMQNTDNLYRNMIRDIYGLGQVLALKFRLLRVSYLVFLIGLFAGIVLFIVVFVGIVWFAPPPPVTPVPVAP